MNEAAQKLGKLGGQKTAQRGKDYYSRIGKQGAVKRWMKKRIQECDCYCHGEKFLACSDCYSNHYKDGRTVAIHACPCHQPGDADGKEHGCRSDCMRCRVSRSTV